MIVEVSLVLKTTISAKQKIMTIILVYWGEWSNFGECNVSCGVGMTIRTRKCINGQDGDITCPMGASYQETECIMENCGK